MNINKELEHDIFNLIEDVYECSFRGEIIVEIQDETYIVKLILNQKERPIQLMYSGAFEDFCKFVKDQIKSKMLNKVDYFTGYKDGYKPSYQKENCDKSIKLLNSKNNGFSYIFIFKLS